MKCQRNLVTGAAPVEDRYTSKPISPNKQCNQRMKATAQIAPINKLLIRNIALYLAKD